jgi:small subunit ribosomal protein S17
MVVRTVQGVVVSNKMMKSVTVMVERIYKHAKFGKYVKGRKKYMVRDTESNRSVLDPGISLPSP